MKHRFLITLLSAGCMLCGAVGCGDDDSSGDTAPDGGQSSRALDVPANARACDLLLRERGSRVTDVSFGDTVKGTFVREAPNVAVSFAATGDSSMASSEIALTFAGDGTDIEVAKVECADADGKSIEGAEVTLK